ncbi:hypothetical protein TEQG_05493 [Trichophyton equinum CBS 127.97]|uniref:Uncharacterized protein n=1 Tax=Trichophyton equinum (strain ATCC MYA-4606 / CBS 127.97) TaxID=559882 RepID=F2PX75_TRIEC|nr:hypothetical protein TEQG_05493 [Trichophyton equinum CBS 127.97]
MSQQVVSGQRRGKRRAGRGREAGGSSWRAEKDQQRQREDRRDRRARGEREGRQLSRQPRVEGKGVTSRLRAYQGSGRSGAWRRKRRILMLPAMLESEKVEI